MKSWFLPLFAGLLLLASPALAMNDVRFDGSAAWAINGDQCTFKVDGSITNYSPKGSKSGSLRLALWVSRSPFPSSGYRVSTYDLGQLSGGYRYNSFKATRDCSMPSVTGFYYFTVVLEQFDGTWKTSDYRPAGTKYLEKGKFSTPKTEKWSPPDKPIKNPVPRLGIGDELTLTLQTTDGVNYVPKGTVLKLRIKIQAKGMTTVYGGSRPEGAPAKFTYKVRSESYKGKKVKVGRLNLDYAVGEYAGTVANSQIRLFFQSASSGFYKSVDRDPNGGGKSGGIFKLK